MAEIYRNVENQRFHLPTKAELVTNVKRGITKAATYGSGHRPEPDGTHTFRILSGVNRGKLFRTQQPEQSYALGRYEPGVTRVLTESLTQGDVFFDVGANVGWDTLLASGKVGRTGRVISFEPGESNLRLLKENIQNNHLKNVTVEPIGIGETTHQIQFAEYDYGLVNHVITPENPAAHDARITTLNVVSIDDYVAAKGITPSVIKIDIEGYEAAALKGAQRTLQQHRPTVVCEVRQDTWDQIQGTFSDLGYSHRFLGGSGRGLATHGVDDVLLMPSAR